MDNLSVSIENLIRELEKTTGNNSSIDDQLSAAHRDGAAAIRAAINNINGGTKLFVKSGVGGTLNALNSTNAGMQKYSNGISALGTGIALFGTGLLGLGAPLIGLAAVITMVTGAVFKQNDAILTNYDKLADFGAAGSFGASQLQDMALSATITSGRLDKYADTIKKVGGNLLSLGGTAGEGMIKFMELSTVTEDTRKQFRNLGMSQEELTEMQANYVNETSMMGARNTRDIAASRRASMRYATEIIELTALTGMTRKEAVDLRQKQLADVSFNLALQSKSPEVAESMLKKVSLFAGIVEDENLASGLRQFMTVGRAIDANGEAFSKLLGDNADVIVSQLVAGTISTVDMVKMLAKNQNSIQLVNSQMVQFSPAFRDLYAMTGNSMKLHNKTINMANDADAERIIAAGKKTTDPLLQLRSTVIGTENALAMAFDKLIKLIAGPVNTAFTWMLQTFNDAITAISDSVIGKALGLSKQAPMNFESIDRAQALIDKNTALLPEYEKRVENIKNDSSASYADKLKAHRTGGEKAEDTLKRLKAEIKDARSYLDKATTANRDAVSVLDKTSTGANSSPTPSSTGTMNAPDEPAMPPRSAPNASAKGAPAPSQYEANDRAIRAARSASYKKEQKEREELLSLFSFSGNATIDGFKKLDSNMQESLMNMARILQKSGSKDKLALLDTYDSKDNRDSRIPNKELGKIESGRAAKLSPSQLEYLKEFDTLNLNNLEIPQSDNSTTYDKGMVQLKAKQGGVFTGPSSGYGIEMHGLEAVVPLPSGQNIPVTIRTDSPLLQSLDQLNVSLSGFGEIHKIGNTLSDMTSKINFMFEDISSVNNSNIDTLVYDIEGIAVKTDQINDYFSSAITKLDDKVRVSGSSIEPPTISIDKSSSLLRDIGEITKMLEEFILSDDDKEVPTVDEYSLPPTSSQNTRTIETPKLTESLLKTVSDNLDIFLVKLKENTSIQNDLLRVARR